MDNIYVHIVYTFSNLDPDISRQDMLNYKDVVYFMIVMLNA